MKIGVSMWSYFRSWKEGMDIPGFIREAKRAGADGVELLDFFYRDVKSKSAIEEDREKALRTLAEVGLPCPIFSVAQNFAKPDPADREQELGKILFGISEAKFYEAQVVRVFAGDVADGITFDQAREWIVDGLAEASKHAANHGLKLALENHGTLAGRGDQVRGIIGDVRSRSGVDALGANPDTGNFLLVNQPSHEAIAEVASLANMVHFKDFKQAPEGHDGFAYTALDGKRFVGTAVGEGEVRLEECIRLLRESGFDGWLSVEYEGEEDPTTAVPRSIVNARKYL
jgi:sugar phosphate isomerase/epimerase